VGSLADSAETRLESEIDSQGGGTAFTIATKQGGAYSLSLTATQARMYGLRRIYGEGLDEEHVSVKALASALATRPEPHWLWKTAANVVWTVVQVEPGGETNGRYLVRLKRSVPKGTPT
jgi:hypothetical protein